MSTKSFLIVNLIEGKLGVIRERSTWDEAVEIGTVMAAEQCGVSKDEIQKELDEDGSFIPRGGGFAVHIAQAEDD